MQVTIRQFVKDLRNALGQASAQKSMQLGKGQCKDHAEYSRVVGLIAGYDGAAQIAQQMLTQMEEAAQEAGDKLPTMETG
jgi:hypothetical protein